MESFNHSADNERKVMGHFFDIDLTGFENLLPYLGEHYSLVRAGEEELPDLFREAVIAYWGGDKTPQATRFHAFTEVEPELVRTRANWTERYFDALESNIVAYHYEPQRLAHDTSALYTPIGPDVVARIAAESSLTACGVQLELIPTEEYENISGEMLSIDRTTETSLETSLMHLATLLGISLDTLIETFETPRHNQKYLLELVKAPLESLSESTSNKIIQPIGSSALEAANLPQLEPSPQPDMLPESEMVNSMEGLSSVGGLFEAKKRLTEIAEDFGDSEAVRLYGITPTHFLLYGDPGTGKTSLVEAFAHEINAELATLTAADISNKWVGGSAKNLKIALEEIINKKQPAVIFFDEVDALIGTQADGSNQTEAKRVFQTAITEITRDYPNIVIAAATNQSLDDIDPAFTRPGRLETIQVRRPTENERADIWATAILNSRHKFDNEWEDGKPKVPSFVPYLNFAAYDYEKLSKATENWTGADVSQALERARRQCWQQYRRSGELIKVSNELLFDIIQNYGRN